MYGKEATVILMTVGMQKHKLLALQNQNAAGQQVQILDGVKKPNAGVMIQ